MLFRDDALSVDFSTGDDVGIHPATDAFMRGLRFGRVSSVSESRVYVRFIGMRDSIPFSPRNLAKVK